MGKRKDSTDAGLEPGAAVTRDEQEKEKKEKKQKKEKKEKKEKKDKKEKKEKKDKKDKKQKKDKAASSADDGSSALKRSPAAAAAASAPPPKKHKSSSSTTDLQPRRSPRLAAAGGGGCGGPPALSLSLGSQGASAEEQQRLDPKHVDLQPAHMLLQHPPVPQFNALVALGVPQWLISATCSGFAQPTLVQQHCYSTRGPFCSRAKTSLPSRAQAAARHSHLQSQLLSCVSPQRPLPNPLLWSSPLPLRVSWPAKRPRS
jgi:hypothetical protein